jgi:hypothetical protein
MIIERWKCVSYCLCKPSTAHGHFERSDSGAWVLYEEAKALEQEVERLKQYEPLKGGVPAREFLLQQENERLRAGLLAHACMCGPTDPNPSVHRENCPYRKLTSPTEPR